MSGAPDRLFCESGRDDWGSWGYCYRDRIGENTEYIRADLAALEAFTDEALVLELVRRNPPQPAPLTTTIGQGKGWLVATVADGKDHTAFLQIMSDGPLAAITVGTKE